jgi:uncharacterized protein
MYTYKESQWKVFRQSVIELDDYRYFFVDIMKEGIMLYDSGKFPLSEPKSLNAAQRVEKMTEEFEHWFEGACRFLETAYIQVERTWYKDAAF